MLKICHVNDPPLEHRTPSYSPADQRQRELSDRSGWDRTVMSDEDKTVIFLHEDRAIERLTQSSRSLGHSVEHRLKVHRRS